MSMPLVSSVTVLGQTHDVPAVTNGLIADAIAACATARAAGFALHGPAVQKLRAVREAGRLLALVQRSDGGRPLNNLSHGLTSYQFALKEAGISRQTANLWRRVAEIHEMDFERFIVETPRAGRDLTITELLRACGPKSETAPARRTVKLSLTEAEYRAFQQQVGVLGAAYFTDTATQTVLTVLAHAHSGWLAAQTRRPRPNGEGIALSPSL